MTLYPHPFLVTAFEHEWGNSKRIYPSLLEYNMAYLVVAAESGAVPAEAAAGLLNTLKTLSIEGPDSLDYRAERDGLQPNVESEIRRRIGIEAGGWLSMGRSRQECELVARQIVARDTLQWVLVMASKVTGVLLTLARRDADAIMPFHTWGQHAEPVTFGYYLASTARTMLDDLSRLEQALGHYNRARAGIGQIVPPPMPVDRDRLAALLGFESPLPNSLHAYGSLDLELGVLSALTIVTANLARFTETLFLWSSTDFGFVRFGPAFTGTSYAMPQKRNPYALRPVRPVAARVAGALTEATQLFSGGPQLVGHGVIHIPNRTIDALDAVRELYDLLLVALPTIEVDRKRMREATSSGMCNAPQLVFLLIEEHKLPFRQAHELCGALVTRAMHDNCSLIDLPNDVMASIVNEYEGFEIDPDAIRHALVPEAIIASRTNGGPAPASVLAEVETMEMHLSAIEERLIGITAERNTASRLLERSVAAITGYDPADC